MNTLLWVMAIVLALAFTIGGLTQILLPKERYRELAASQHWADDFSGRQVKAIGTIKTIGALGLVLPALVVPVLVPLAASGLMLFMAGAGTTRFRRGEYGAMVGDLLFLSAFAFLAWGRFALEPLGG